MKAPAISLPPRLQIIVAELPPTIDGIGDYTAHLAKELAGDGLTSGVEILTGPTAADAISGVSIRHIFDPARPASTLQIVEAVAAARPDWVVLQYNPFAYGRRGLNLHLPRAMKQLRAAVPQTRLAVMFHETYVPMNSLKFVAMTTYQRWQFYQLGRTADVSFFSIEPWAQLHCRRFAPRPVCHLPVGSNIPLVDISRTEARHRLQIDDDELVLGVFGNAHVSRLLSLVKSAAQAAATQGRRVRLLYIGPDSEAVKSALGSVVPITADGPHPADEVSRRLSAIDIFLATYSDGVSTRRGAMMAALQHGLAVVGTAGHHTDTELHQANGDSIFLVPVNDAAMFAASVVRLAADGSERDRLGKNAKLLFDRRYSWGAIAKTMMSTLATFSSSDQVSST